MEVILPIQLDIFNRSIFVPTFNYFSFSGREFRFLLFFTLFYFEKPP